MNKIFSISTPADFNFSECIKFLQRSSLECLFLTEKEEVRFALEIQEEIFVLRLFWKKNKIHIETLQGELTSFSKKKIKNHVSEWLDVSQDLSGFYKMSKSDFLLKKLTKEFSGLRLVGIPNLLEAISWAIIGQQINLTFAYTLKKRLVENFGEKVNLEGCEYFLFPKAETIANLTEDDLRPMQFSRSKIKYLTGGAAAIAADEFSKNTLAQLPYENAKALLLKYKGVGNWTADYVLMKCLRFPDAFPLSDVGLHNAIKYQMNLEQKPSIESVEKMSQKWKGYKSYAAFYLWHSLLE